MNEERNKFDRRSDPQNQMTRDLAQSAEFDALQADGLTELLRGLDREEPRPGFERAVVLRLTEERRRAIRRPAGAWWRYTVVPSVIVAAALFGVLTANWSAKRASSTARQGVQAKTNVSGAGDRGPAFTVEPSVERALESARRAAPQALGSRPPLSPTGTTGAGDAQALLARYQSLSIELDGLRRQAAEARPLIALSGPDDVDFVVDLRQFLLLDAQRRAAGLGTEGSGAGTRRLLVRPPDPQREDLRW